MPAFHLLRCNVAIGGDSGNTVYRDRTRPIVFPELPILQFMHGEEAVTDIAVVGQWDAPNDEVLSRITQIYSPEVVKEVFPGARPRLPMADASIPRCTLPVYKPRPTRPDSPDPRLKPLGEFATTENMVEAPPLEPEDDPSPDEIAAHVQDDDDDPTMPRPEDLPRIIDKRTASSKARTPSTLPDVAAGGSHSPAAPDPDRVIPHGR